MPFSCDMIFHAKTRPKRTPTVDQPYADKDGYRTRGQQENDPVEIVPAGTGAGRKHDPALWLEDHGTMDGFAGHYYAITVTDLPDPPGIDPVADPGAALAYYRELLLTTITAPASIGDPEFNEPDPVDRIVRTHRRPFCFHREELPAAEQTNLARDLKKTMMWTDFRARCRHVVDDTRIAVLGAGRG